MPDGQVLVNPSNTDLAQAIGMQTEASEPMYNLIIIGAGPAGLGAGRLRWFGRLENLDD